MRTLKSQEPIYVIGHLNPDTDAICAAIGYADYLSKAESMNAVPLRCGHVPSRVEWVLEQAGIEAPTLINDVRTTAELICDKDTTTVLEDETFLSVYNAMQQSGMDSIPVVSKCGEIRGILDFTQLMQLLMPQDDSGSSKSVKVVTVSPTKVLKSLKGQSHGMEIHDNEEALTMFVGASSEKSTIKGIQKICDKGISDKQLVICGDRMKLQRAAVENKVRMLVVTGGYSVSDELAELAKKNGVMIISCKYDTATTVQLIRCSRQVSSALGAEFLCVNASDAVSDIRKRLSVAPQELFPVVKRGSLKLLGVFTKADLVAPPATKLVLVDHNEYSQAVRGVEEANVMIVLDHHRLGGNVVSREPIHFLNEPVGSSSTLVARKYRDSGVELTRGIALCLCAGLISDTLNLTSPTTTMVDKNLLVWLCGIAGVDADQFTHDFFASGSLMLKGTVEEIVNTDRKEFYEGGKSVSITQVEEIVLSSFDERKDEIKTELLRLAKNKGYDLAIAAITDITKHVSLIIAVGEQRIIDALPFEVRPDGSIRAEGVVSRKKQIFPAVCDAIHKSSATTVEDV